MNAVKKKHLVVVGGGITGLFGALIGSEMGYDVTIITKDIAGLISDYRQGEFYFETAGSHVYTPNHEFILELLYEAGAVENTRKAFYDYSLKVPYPVQSHADRLGIEIETSNEILTDNLENFGISSFGKRFHKKWFRPFNERVWTVSPLTMSADWITSRVTPPYSKAGTNWGPNAKFLGCPGRKILAQIMKRLSDHDINYIIDGAHNIGTRIKCIFTESGKTVQYDSVLWTAPIGMLAKSSIRERNVFLHNVVLTVGVGLNRELKDPFHWVYPKVSLPAHRVAAISRFHPGYAPKGKDSLSVEIPYKASPASLRNLNLTTKGRASQSDKRPLAIDYLNKAGINGIAQKDIQELAFSIRSGYPIQTIGLRKNVAKVKNRYISNNIVFAGRWGSWVYANIDHCYESARAALEALECGMNDHYAYDGYYYDIDQVKEN